MGLIGIAAVLGKKSIKCLTSKDDSDIFFYMNKNSKRRQRQIAAEAKQAGGFSKPVYKKKVRPFPVPHKDEDVSLSAQREVFYGKR